MIFWNFRQYGAKAYVLSFPEEGDARTHGGIISFELSPLARCMRINSNRDCPRVTESDWEWNQSQEKRGERGMRDREDRVR